MRTRIASFQVAEFPLARRLASAYIFAPSPCGGMADAIDLKSIAARHGGSTPSTGTRNYRKLHICPTFRRRAKQYPKNYPKNSAPRGTGSPATRPTRREPQPEARHTHPNQLRTTPSSLRINFRPGRDDALRPDRFRQKMRRGFCKFRKRFPWILPVATVDARRLPSGQFEYFFKSKEASNASVFGAQCLSMSLLRLLQFLTRPQFGGQVGLT